MSFLGGLFGNKPEENSLEPFEDINVTAVKPEKPELPKLPPAPPTIRSQGLNPGRMEEPLERLKALVSPDPIEGIKFEVNHMVQNNTLALSHVVTGLGTEKPTYNLTTQTQKGNQAWVTRFDSGGMVFGRYVLEAGLWAVSLTGQTGSGQTPNAANVSFDYAGGKTWTSGFKYEFPSHLEFTFIQGMTRALALGVQASVNPLKPINSLIGMIKYQPRDNKSCYTIQAAPSHVAAGAYFNPVSGVQFGSELTVVVNPQVQHSIAGGLDLQYIWSRWKGTLDDKIVLNTIYEENLTPQVKGTVTMTNDIRAGDLKFGVGLSFSDLFAERSTGSDRRTRMMSLGQQVAYEDRS